MPFFRIMREVGHRENRGCFAGNEGPFEFYAKAVQGPNVNSLTRRQARRIALRAQGFGARPAKGEAGWQRLHSTIARMGLVQLDSVNVFLRSHYLPLYARAGSYDRSHLDRRAFGTRHRPFFEYWAHEASLLPLEFHPLLRWRMARAAAGEGLYRDMAEFVLENRPYLDAVLGELARRGPLSARDLEDAGSRNGPWWGWSRGKMAMEYLFWTGQVTTASRRNFERIYDLSERVIPDSVLSLPSPSTPDAIRGLLQHSAAALGVATERDLRDYFRLPVRETHQALAELLEAGVLESVQVQDWGKPAFRYRDSGGPRKVDASAFLSPFDPMIWERDRAKRLFDFDYKLEIYTPAAKRRFGYYVVPFLLGDEIVARLDLKSDRQTGLLRVLAAYGEKGRDRGRTLDELESELPKLMDWLGLKGVAVESKGDLGKDLAKRLTCR